MPATQVPPVEAPHCLGGDAVTERLDVDPRLGLSDTEARKRLTRYGPNLIQPPQPESTWRILIRQFQSIMVWLLTGAAALSAAFGQVTEAVAILAVLVLNAAIGFTTEYKAIRSLESLRKLGQHFATVRREGRDRRVPAEEIVPGDLVPLEAGEQVPADLRLLSASSLSCDESLLTGESAPVGKSLEPLPSDTIVAERSNMAFKGTLVTRGSGEGVAVSTGMGSELGRISRLVEQAESERSPLEQRLAKLGAQLVWVTLAMIALIVGAGILGGKDWILMLETGIALAVAAVPEGLPVVATLALARGLWRMARRNALVERLSAVETLGATTVICVDKTGTLTENRMTVTRLALPDGEVDLTEGAFLREGRPTGIDSDDLLRHALEIMALCNNASLARKNAVQGPAEAEQAVGDPMEVGLLRAARADGLERPALLEQFPEIREVAFREDVKMMATFHARDGAPRIAIKGAPEVVIARCGKIVGATGAQPLSQDLQARWLTLNRDLASTGLRVLALAEGNAKDETSDPYEDMALVGLVGLIDPPRADALPAVAACRDAGIRLVMLTGDQLQTARTIAAHVGFDPSLLALEGQDLRDAPDTPEARRDLLRAEVFARLSPRQKLDLIKLHQAAGDVVAMTGDGVNDAPALRQADIGIAMGQRGSEVAREAAEIVLLDDAFPSIVAAVRYGRIIFDNLRKFAVYLLSCNLSEILLVSLATLGGLPLPLLPLQILYLNLVTDVFPALALGLCEGGDEVMRRPPRHPETLLLGRWQWFAVFGYGCLITITTLSAFWIALEHLELPYRDALTVSFMTLALAQVWHVFNLRETGDRPILNEVTANPWVWGAVLLCIGLIGLGVAYPPLAGLLRLEVPDWRSLWLVVSASLFPLILGQIFLIWRDRREGLGAPGRSAGEPRAPLL